MNSSARTLVCLATYQERNNLERLVEEILGVAPLCQVLVVDDHSPDGTGELADTLAERDERVHVIHRAGKLGLGTAILTGLRYALAHDFDYFVTMDADFSHHPRYLPAVLDGMAEHDVMIGSRYVSGGGTENWPWLRRAMSGAVNRLTRCLLGLPAQDISGGFRCYRTALVRSIDLASIRSVGYSFEQEMLYRCVHAGARVGETPICFEDRRAGVSKLTVRETIRSVSALLMLGLRVRLGPAAAPPSR